LVFQAPFLLNFVPILLLFAGLQAEPGGLSAARAGAVASRDLDSWRAYLEAEGEYFRLRYHTARQHEEDIVVLRALDRQFASAPAAERRVVDLRHRTWQLERAAHQLRGAMRTEAAPSDAEVRAIYESNPALYGEPQSWVLENIFKRYPEAATAEDKARVRQALEEIRRRALAGEDFPTLARAESDSETRLRGGDLGAPYLSQLAPAVAEVVSKLKAGDISPVFEVPGGVTILRCVRILEAKPPSLEDARPKIARPRGNKRFEEAWSALTARLAAGLATVVHPEAARAAEADAAVASFTDRGSPRRLTREELDVFLSSRGLSKAALSPQRLQELITERVMMEALFPEAEARGLTAGEAYSDLSRWKRLELEAAALEDALPVAEPTEAELRAAWAAEGKDEKTAERFKLEALRLWLLPDSKPEVYEDARKWGERLAAGSAGFEEAARALVPPATREDLGWMDDDQVWMMGVNVDAAVKAAAAGASTRLVQEGKALFILHVLAREPERALTFEEARPSLRETLREKARRAAAAEMRRRVLDEARVGTP